MSRMKHRSNEARGRIEGYNRGHGLERFEVSATRGLGDLGSRRAARGRLVGPGGEASC
jgi:hypothetical protein